MAGVLRYASYAAVTGADGTLTYILKARLADAKANAAHRTARLPRKSTVKRVTLFYHIMRRPLAALRQMLGVHAPAARGFAADVGRVTLSIASVAEVPRERLLALREELALFPGPTAIDGLPTWTLQDPISNRFYRIAWPEFEILSRWDLGEVDRICRAVNRDTPLDIDENDVIAVGRFLSSHNLVRSIGVEGTNRLLQSARRMRGNWAMWLLKNYLLLRIPLVRAGWFSGQNLAYVSWIYSRKFAAAIIVLATIGIYSVGRQWASFVHTFNYLFSLEGVVWFAITISVIKIMHELGHAIPPNVSVAACQHGNCFPRIVAGALYRRNGKLEACVAAAAPWRRHSGVTAELIFAAIATFTWGVLPDGPAAVLCSWL